MSGHWRTPHNTVGLGGLQSTFTLRRIDDERLDWACHAVPVFPGWHRNDGARCERRASDHLHA